MAVAVLSRRHLRQIVSNCARIAYRPLTQSRSFSSGARIPSDSARELDLPDSDRFSRSHLPTLRPSSSEESRTSPRSLDLNRHTTSRKVFDKFSLRSITNAEKTVESFLRDLGLNDHQIERIIHKYPDLSMLYVDLKLTEEILALNFTRDEIQKAILVAPTVLLGMEAGELSRCLELINTLKCRVPIKNRVLSKGPLMASINLKLRIDLLCKRGLIIRDAFKVIYVEPRIILYDLQDTENKIDYLLNNLGLDIEWLIEFPGYLGVNLEKQIIPRHKVIKTLRSMDALGYEPGLKQLVKLSRSKFYNMFVKPYPECHKIFGGAVRNNVEIKQTGNYVTGLWKMFKPPKFPDSKEDVKNIKFLVQSL